MPDAIVLFDGKNLAHWFKADGNGPVRWKLVEGGAVELNGGDIKTEASFDGHFKLHIGTVRKDSGNP